MQGPFSKYPSKLVLTVEVDRADLDRQRGPFSIAVTSIGEEAGRLASLSLQGKGRGTEGIRKARTSWIVIRGGKIKGHAGGKSVSAR